MAASIVRGVFKGIKEKGIANFVRDLKDEGYLKCLSDGNLLKTKIHSIGATLVGVDRFGNKYYQKLAGDTQYGRHRWVEYADKGRYTATQVPSEWHGWLHFMTDHIGDELLMLRPTRHGLELKESFSGEGDIYYCKGHTLNRQQRDWKRYQTWQPAIKSS